jgi:hypothetical protein
MKYIVAKNAEAFGFNPKLHRIISQGMILNEAEVLRNYHLKGTLDERVKELEGTIYDIKDLKLLIKNK